MSLSNLQANQINWSEPLTLTMRASIMSLMKSGECLTGSYLVIEACGLYNGVLFEVLISKYGTEDFEAIGYPDKLIGPDHINHIAKHILEDLLAENDEKQYVVDKTIGLDGIQQRPIQCSFDSLQTA